jgi:hypothetical protein
MQAAIVAIFCLVVIVVCDPFVLLIVLVFFGSVSRSYFCALIADPLWSFQSEAVRVLEAPLKSPLLRADCVVADFMLSQLMSLSIHCATL